MPTYCIEPARSSRATCKACTAKIDQGELRIGTTAPGPGDYDITSWRHLDCHTNPGKVQPLLGVEALSPANRAKHDAWKANPLGFRQKRAREADDAPSSPAKSQKVPLKPTPVKSKPNKSAGASPSPYAVVRSAAAEAAARDLAECTFSRLRNDTLKQCLRANSQKVGGNKQELLERCVDAKLFGSLPRCSVCGIGLLRVRYAGPGHGGQGSFSCPGGYDDDAYRPCSFRSNSVRRPDWVVTDDEKNAEAAAVAAAAGAPASSSSAPAAPAAAAPSVAGSWHVGPGGGLISTHPILVD